MDVAKINQHRWEIEECFGMMKSEFRASPVHLSIEERIRAYFLIGYLALLAYRILEKKLAYKFSCPKIIRTVRDMNFLEVKGDGYIPTYTRTSLTDALHKAFGF